MTQYADMDFRQHVHLMKSLKIEMHCEGERGQNHPHYHRSYGPFDYIESALHLQNLAQLHDFCTKISRDFGISKFGFGIMRPDPGSQGAFTFLHGGHDDWVRIYQRQLVFIDPVIRHALVENTYFLWHHRQKSNFMEKKSPVMFNVLRDFRAKCLIQSFCTNPAGNHGGLRFTHFGSDSKPMREITGLLPMLSFLCPLVHEAAVRILSPAGNDSSITLSCREKEILLWVANGKTSWEISVILGISENTVLAFMKRIHAKLKVSSRQHAVAKAISMNIISL